MEDYQYYDGEEEYDEDGELIQKYDQEDDWDRDAVLDPAWERQQRKVGLGSTLVTHGCQWSMLRSVFDRNARPIPFLQTVK